MKKAVIVHCWSGNPEYCWYPYAKRELEAKGFEVKVPAMPDTDTPNLAKWLPVLKEAVGIPDENTFLIGHSVGCMTVLRYLESLAPGQKVGGVVLVAGYTYDLGFEELKNFLTTPIPFDQIKERANHFVAIHSDNDQYVPLASADVFRERLGAEIIIKHAMNHFAGPQDGEPICAELPDVVESVLKISH